MIPQQTVKQVRALYDFEAVEDNEISFVAGDIITITDDRSNFDNLKYWSKLNFKINFKNVSINLLLFSVTKIGGVEPLHGGWPAYFLRVLSQPI